MNEIFSKTELNLVMNEQMAVNELEEQFVSKFGLSAQVFRKSGNVWLETSATDSWSLRQQNDEGAELSRQINPRREAGTRYGELSPAHSPRRRLLPGGGPKARPLQSGIGPFGLMRTCFRWKTPPSVESGAIALQSVVPCGRRGLPSFAARFLS